MQIFVDYTIKLELIKEEHTLPLYDLVSSNRQHLREWLPWVDQMKDEDFIRNFIKASQQRYEEGGEYAFVILENNQLIGRLGVYKVDTHNRIGEIGYWIGKETQGKGIVAKCCKALIDFCFNSLHLNRIKIKCGTENIRSQSIPEKLIFNKEGVLRQAELLHGKFIDLNLYSLLKEEASNK